MESFWQDLRFGIRMLLQKLGFTATVVLTLATGIGVNSAMFSIVNTLLLRPLPVQESDGLAMVYSTDANNPGLLGVSTDNFEDLRDQNEVFDGLTAFSFAQLSLRIGQQTDRVLGIVSTVNYFKVLGVTPVLGRDFLAEEGKSLGGDPVTILGYGFWQRRFNGDPDIVGQAITINRRPFTVIGVAPADFKGVFVGVAPDLWVPYSMRREVMPGFELFTIGRRGLWLMVIGRLRDGISIEQADAGMKTLARQLELAYPNDNEGRSTAVISLDQARRNPTGGAQNPMLIMTGFLMAMVGLVLLIACANVANLLLARGNARQKEIAIRAAMGAGRLRQVRQFLTESLVLALISGATGLLLAYWCNALLNNYQPPLPVPIDFDFQVDFRVVLYCLGISLLTALIFGLLPALQSSRSDINETLKEGGRSLALPGRQRLRTLLVAGEVSLALITLVGSGLFLRSLWSAMAVDPGFEPDNMLVMNVDVGLEGYDQSAGKVFYDQLIERMPALPGVRSATLATRLPLTFGISRTVYLEGQDPSDPNVGILVQVNNIGADYFSVLGIPILKGREFRRSDDANSPMIAVINETMASRFWPDKTPLGERFRLPAEGSELTPQIEVVGIARNSKYQTLGEEPIPFLYLPLRQHYNAAVALQLRTEADPRALIPAIRNEIRDLDSMLPVFGVQTMKQQIGASLWPARLGAFFLGLFGLLALILAAVGIYGVVSFSTTQRTQEIGVRMAMGASSLDIVRMVIRQGMLVVLGGLVVGVLLALAMTQGISALLIGVRPSDPVTYGVIVVLLGAVALLACYLPARRAARIAPSEALRYQ